jgi:adenylate kinase
MTQATRLSAPRPTAETSRRVFVMLGAPGAGKGTQASRLAISLGLPHVSTGDLFRTALRNGSQLGDDVRRFVERGTLVPDVLTIKVIADRLAQPDARGGAVLDGFPRTRRQAEALDALLGAEGAQVAGALYIEVDGDELVRRMSGRRVCTGPGQHVYQISSRPPAVPGICDIDGSPLDLRPDDRPETIRARLDKQLPPMFEVVDHYADAGVLHAVRGDRPVDEISAELLRLIGRPEGPR